LLNSDPRRNPSITIDAAFTYLYFVAQPLHVVDVYSLMARLNHTHGVADVGVTGLYRVLSRRETFPKFELERLSIVYRGPFSGVVAAVKPDGPISPPVTP
jgi:hypothetical protein